MNEWVNAVFALAALPGCPNLVRYYDAWYEDDGDVLFVQMEFLGGGTLATLAKQRRLSQGPSLWDSLARSE